MDSLKDFSTFRKSLLYKDIIEKEIRTYKRAKSVTLDSAPILAAFFSGIIFYLSEKTNFFDLSIKWFTNEKINVFISIILTLGVLLVVYLLSWYILRRLIKFSKNILLKFKNNSVGVDTSKVFESEKDIPVYITNKIISPLILSNSLIELIEGNEELSTEKKFIVFEACFYYTYALNNYINIIESDKKDFLLSKSNKYFSNSRLTNLYQLIIETGVRYEKFNVFLKSENHNIKSRIAIIKERLSYQH